MQRVNLPPSCSRMEGREVMRNPGNLPRYEYTPAGTLRGSFKAGLVICTILAACFGAIALAGGNSVRSDPTESSEPAEHKAAEQRAERSGVFLAYQTLY
jgi:hypothetical protein